MDELRWQTRARLLFYSHLMEAEDPAESFRPVWLFLREKHRPHRGEVKEVVKEEGRGRDA